MASTRITWLLPHSLPPHCSPESPFLTDLSVIFQTCVPTNLALISTLLGCISISCWLFAQMPQVFKNYQLKSTAGLSMLFITEWLLGDATNLLGAIFTEQARWQIVLATYYVFIDTCMIVQYIWYTHLTRKVYGESLHSSIDSDRDGDSDSINALSPINTNFVEERATFKDDDVGPKKSPVIEPRDGPLFSQVNYEKGRATPPQSVPDHSDKYGSSWMSSASPKALMFTVTVSSLVSKATAMPVPIGPSRYSPIVGWTHSHADSSVRIAGKILSWSSTFFYLGSRLPQLHKNWKRKSVAGLSPVLFAAAFSGNLFYSSSLLTNPNAWHNFKPYGGGGWADEEGSYRWDWIARASPFFLGAAGTLILDMVVGVQFWKYGEDEWALVKVRDGHGHSRWQRVSGWMRGWIPNMGRKERIVDLSESQRLLNEQPSMSRHWSSTRDYGTT